MKTNNKTRFLSSLFLMLAFCLAPSQVSSMSSPAPEQPQGVGNDAYADLAIGVPGRDDGTYDSAGMVAVVYGTDDDLDLDNADFFSQTTPWIGGDPDNNSVFGQRLAGGDFDGDGIMDLAIGAPGDRINYESSYVDNAGSVTVIYGSSSGFYATNSVTRDHSDFPGNQPEEDDRFGEALASGDFNLDGYDDLAVGVPGQNYFGVVPNAGAVYVVYGSPSGLTWSNFDGFQQGFGILETPEEGDNFGSVLAVGDFDGDAYDDLAISAPYEDLTVGASSYTRAGVVQIVYGSRSGLSIDGDNLLYQGHDGLQDSPENNDFFGESLAAGDFDGDGRDDLAIGVPHEDLYANEDGVIHIVWGEFYGITTENDLRIYQQLMSGYTNEAGDIFGWAMTTGRFDSDDQDDLVIGVPGQKAGLMDRAGMVHIMRGPFKTYTFLETFVGTASEEHMGYSLAAGDLNDNGMDDLVIGAPYYGYGSIPTYAGMVVPYYFPSGGGTFIYLSDLNSGALTPAVSDTFGYSLVILDEPHYRKLAFLPIVRK